jgi:hypothetical protein
LVTLAQTDGAVVDISQTCIPYKNTSSMYDWFKATTIRWMTFTTHETTNWLYVTWKLAPHHSLPYQVKSFTASHTT